MWLGVVVVDVRNRFKADNGNKGSRVVLLLIWKLIKTKVFRCLMWFSKPS